MNDLLDDFGEQISFTDKEIFTQIWTKPKEVLSYVHDTQHDKYVIILLVFAGISKSLDRAVMRDMGDQIPLALILGKSIFLGGLLGWLTYYVYSALVSWTGKWLGGNADTNSILRVLAYAMIPSIVALFFVFLQIGVYGQEIFKADGDTTSGGMISQIIFFGSAAMELILGILTLIYCVIGISVVQEFGTTKAFFNLIFPILILLIPILILILGIGAFK